VETILSWALLRTPTGPVMQAIWPGLNVRLTFLKMAYGPGDFPRRLQINGWLNS